MLLFHILFTWKKLPTRISIFEENVNRSFSISQFDSTAEFQIFLLIRRTKTFFY